MTSMQSSSHRLIALLLLAMLGMMACFINPAQAQTNALTGAPLNVPATLVAERDRAEPGKRLTLAFLMQPKQGWHGYWSNPGDAGVGQTFEWTLPTGVRVVGEPRYPVPETLLIAGIMNYVYEGEYAVLVDLAVDAGIAPGTELPIRVASNWLSCTREVCVPEADELAITLTAGAGGKADARFDAFRAALPRPLGSEASYQVKDGLFRLSVPFPAGAAIERPYFFIDQDGVLEYSAPQAVFRDGDRLIIETKARKDNAQPISGILKTGEHRGLILSAAAGEVTGGGSAIPAGGGDGSNGNGGGDEDGKAPLGLLIGALGGAILGGLLLNLMPCVFPILSLKAISLAKAGGEETAARRDALAYTAGVVLVATALGALLLALRASGAAVGWAFQLQDVRVIFLLLVLVTAIALNLAGLFEIPSLAIGSRAAQSGGVAGSFWTGALAAFVATPCTGPFMAAALGATIVLPPVAALFIFAGLGIGLALPFLALAFIPALRNRLPKPGPWLDRFRKVMAVPMFLTALALVWLLARQVSADGLAIALGGTLIVALLLWIYGNGQRQGAGRGWWTAGGAVAALVAAALLLPTATASTASKQDALDTAILPAEPFSETRLAELRAANQPVFAYFTADWCLTCKANEATAIQREETAQAFASADVAVLEGDWTQPDPEISRFLESHGRNGVPLYLWYAPGREPEILPQILSVATLTGLVAEPSRTASLR